MGLSLQFEVHKFYTVHVESLPALLVDERVKLTTFYLGLDFPGIAVTGQRLR